jgi:hypothetical protein
MAEIEQALENLVDTVFADPEGAVKELDLLIDRRGYRLDGGPSDAVADLLVALREVARRLVRRKAA